MFNNGFLQNRTVYEKMWKNIVEPSKDKENNMAHGHGMLDT
jgi:hypothetical protein